MLIIQGSAEYVDAKSMQLKQKAWHMINAGSKVFFLAARADSEAILLGLVKRSVSQDSFCIYSKKRVENSQSAVIPDLALENCIFQILWILRYSSLQFF
jgi:hypothetical protein